MNFKICGVKVKIETMFLIFVLVVLAFKGVRGYFENYIICFLFVVFHEFSHILVASMLGVECKGINVRACGMNAVFSFSNMLSIRWLYILSAGPLSNVLLAIVFNQIKFVRDINLSLAIVNMLPIAPLDGYGICKILLECVLPKRKVKHILLALKYILLIVIVLLGIYILVFTKNPAILLFVFYIVILRYAWKVCAFKYVTKKLQKCYKILLKLLHFSLKFSII